MRRKIPQAALRMSETHPDDLQVRILRLLDGELGDEEVIRLDAELRASREARALFIQLAALHSALEDQGNSCAAIRKVPVIPIERLLARQRQRAIRTALFAAAAVVLLSLLGLWLKMAPQPAAALAGFRVGPDSHFTLIHAAADDAPAGDVLAKGSRLHLSRGTTEGTFASGVRFLVEAPCDFTVLADDRISLAEGVAWFEVTPQAAGFTVETRHLEIMDLGTRFGVIAPVEGPHEIHVTKGAVEVAAQHGGSTKTVVKAGEALRLSSRTTLESIPLRLERFTKALPERIPISNPSFELDRNTDPEGRFDKGNRSEFGGELTGWKAIRGAKPHVHIGWRGIKPASLHPYPPAAGEKSQALSLISGAAVHTLTGTSWSRLRAGDKLTLTLSLGMRGGLPALDWNENTFFSLTDEATDLATTDPAGTVAHSGMIANNPATGTRTGDGTLKDISFSHTIQPADTTRPGRIGILIHSAGTGRRMREFNQAFFDHVRLHLTRNPDAPPGGR
jgi:hypothetical protein